MVIYQSHLTERISAKYQLITVIFAKWAATQKRGISNLILFPPPAGCENGCSRHGQCTMEEGDYKCVCIEGWAGSDCSIPLEMNCKDNKDNDGGKWILIIRNFPRNFRWDLKLAELPQRKRAIVELLNAEIMRNIIRRRKLFRIGLSEFNLNSPIDCVGEGVCRCVWRHKMIFALSYSSVRHKETKLFAVLFPWGERMLLLYLPHSYLHWNSQKATNRMSNEMPFSQRNKPLES